jgi:Fe-S-cluster containining protein
MKEARACGSCSACCTLLRIDPESGFSTRFDTGEDIAKAAGEPCRYLGLQGCSIYTVRPLVCRSFQCDYLKGRKGFLSPAEVGYFGLRGSKFYIPKEKVLPNQ